MCREVVGRERRVCARDGDEETLRPRDDLRPAVVDERKPRVLRELRISEAVTPDRRVRVEVELQPWESSRRLVSRPREEDRSAPRMTRRERNV